MTARSYKAPVVPPGPPVREVRRIPVSVARRLLDVSLYDFRALLAERKADVEVLRTRRGVEMRMSFAEVERLAKFIGKS